MPPNAWETYLLMRQQYGHLACWPYMRTQLLAEHGSTTFFEYLEAIPREDETDYV